VRVGPVLHEALSSFQTLFAKLIRDRGIEAVQELLAGLEQTKTYLEETARREGLPSGAGSGTGLPEDMELVEIAEELEEVDGDHPPPPSPL
jgi:hypothetical protein